MTAMALVLATLPAFAGEKLLQIRFGQQQSSTRIVLELEKTADFRVTTTATPPALVVELPALSTLPDLGAAGVQPPVTAVRHDLAPGGTSRIVFDLNGAANVRNAFMIGPDGKKPARLVIDVAAGKTDDTRAFGTMPAGPVAAREQKPAPAVQQPQMPAKQQPAPDTGNTPQQVTFKPLVFIDAGHGGQDPGATSAAGAREKDITLAVALEAAKLLRDAGRYRVNLTRDDDRFIKLGERVMLAREAQADLFISLHADSMGAGAARATTKGASVYTLSARASDAQAASLAARENAADSIGGVNLSAQSPDVANILVDLMMRDTAGKSALIAGQIISAFRAAKVATLPGPHKSAGFMVLKAPDMPSILIEMGYLSNTGEAALLGDPKHRKTIADAVLKGVDAYFGQQAAQAR